MDANNLVKIDLLNFIGSGIFDCIRLGQKKSWILNNFPNPDDISSPNNDEFEILCYGSIELHFKNEILYLIFTDNIDQREREDTFYTGSSLKFTNKSFFGKKVNLLNLPYVMASFLSEKIDFHAKYDKYGNVELITKGRVSLLFEPLESESIDDFRLIALSLYNEKYIKF